MPIEPFTPAQSGSAEALLSQAAKGQVAPPVEYQTKYPKTDEKSSSTFDPSKGYTVVRNISPSGWSGAQYHSSGEFSRTQEPTWDTTGSKPDRTEDVLADIQGRSNIIMPQSLYERYKDQLGSARNITVVPDQKIQDIAVSGERIQSSIEAEKQAIQEARRQSFQPSSLAGYENIERAMLKEKAQTDWSKSFSDIVSSSPGVREKLEQAKAISYDVAGKTFETQAAAQAYAQELANQMKNVDLSVPWYERKWWETPSAAEKKNTIILSPEEAKKFDEAIKYAPKVLSDYGKTEYAFEKAIGKERYAQEVARIEKEKNPLVNIDFKGVNPITSFIEQYKRSRPTSEEEELAKATYQQYSDVEKAGLLVTTGFGKPEIAGKYFEQKIFGIPTGYEKDIYEYAIKDAQIIDIPLIGRQLVPKGEVVKDVGLGIGTALLMGAVFKGLTYIGSPIIRGGLGLGERGLLGASKGLEVSAAARTGIATKTALQTTSTLTEVAAKPLGYGARHPELVLGAGFVVPFAIDIAGSKTRGEALAKLGYTASTLPLMGVGYTGAGLIGGTVREATPTPREFLQFTTKKAEPISKTKTAKFIEEKTPDFVKKLTEPIRVELTRDPYAIELMPQKTREIYKALPTKEAKIMLETAFRAKELIKDIPERSVKKMYQADIGFDITKDLGIKGLEIEKVMRKQPKDILLGSLSTAKFVKGFREVRGTTPEGVKLGTGIGDIELASDMPKKYIDVGMKKGDIHGISGGHFAFGRPGQKIRTSFGGETTELAGARVLKPVKVEGIQYLHPLQQAAQKTEGMIKFLSRKTEVVKGAAREKEYSKERGEMTGFSMRRGKDVPDVPEIVEALAKAHPEKAKGEKAIELMKKFREAEKTKLYAATPEFIALERGYALAKEYPKVVKTPPIFTGENIVVKPVSKVDKVEYYDVSGGKKTQYYPPAAPKIEKVIGGYYPASGKPEKQGYYPTSTKKEEGGYYPSTYEPSKYPSIYSPNQYPRPFMDRYWNQELQSEIARDEVFINKSGEKESRKKAKSKAETKYLYKFRASPIYEKNVEKIFGVDSSFVITKPQYKRTKKSVKITKPKPLDLGLSNVGFKTNPIKTKYVKTKKSNKKQFWEM